MYRHMSYDLPWALFCKVSRKWTLRYNVQIFVTVLRTFISFFLDVHVYTCIWCLLVNALTTHTGSPDMYHYLACSLILSSFVLLSLPSLSPSPFISILYPSSLVLSSYEYIDSFIPRLSPSMHWSTCDL